MNLEAGSILAGKVTGITKFGAFVTVAPGKSGLVHISEIANTFVNNVSDFLTEGQEVQVKVLSIDENGRLNLSIKAALPAPVKKEHQEPRRGGQTSRNPASFSGQHGRSQQPPDYTPMRQSSDASFEDKLKRFMQDSDSKMAGVRLYSEKKTRRRSR